MGWWGEGLFCVFSVGKGSRVQLFLLVRRVVTSQLFVWVDRVVMSEASIRVVRVGRILCLKC